jgi:hypothetical protein
LPLKLLNVHHTAAPIIDQAWWYYARTVQTLIVAGRSADTAAPCPAITLRDQSLYSRKPNNNPFIAAYNRTTKIVSGAALTAATEVTA